MKGRERITVSPGDPDHEVPYGPYILIPGESWYSTWEALRNAGFTGLLTRDAIRGESIPEGLAYLDLGLGADETLAQQVLDSILCPSECGSD